MWFLKWVSQNSSHLNNCLRDFCDLSFVFYFWSDLKLKLFQFNIYSNMCFSEPDEDDDEESFVHPFQPPKGFIPHRM